MLAVRERTRLARRVKTIWADQAAGESRAWVEARAQASMTTNSAPPVSGPASLLVHRHLPLECLPQVERSGIGGRHW